MSVGVLIITHEGIATAILETAANIFGKCPLRVEVLPAARDCDTDVLRNRVKQKVEQLDDGNGVLVLLDIYGSTPSNVACSVVDEDRVRVISGLNLPMLVRIFNYPTLALPELAKKAVSGGKDGIFVCHGGESKDA
ncbi:MAG TPA: PTS fructose transporter subunit IIA [Gammaproteobacteria bacterium]|nr:PTS fructose transporter subunit IIA [Gammaproteobacteria bacterium]